MRDLSWEVRNIQNPALGAALLWRFACGFSNAHPVSDHAPFHLLFIVLPLLFHEQTSELVKNTQKASGLHAFVAKFSASKNSKHDVLLSLHDRVAALRELTLESFRVGQRGRLLLLNPSGRVISLTETITSAGDAATKLLLSNAEKIGAWCGPLTLVEVAIALKVRF